MLAAICSYLSEMMGLMRRFPDCDTETNPSGKHTNIPKAYRKLPKELLDHIGCHGSVVSHGNFLSALGQEPGIYDRSRVSLWTSIFKNDLWLQNMREEHNAEPVLIGSQLHELMEGHNAQPVVVGSQPYELSKKKYVILYVCEALRIPAGSWKLFRKGLHDHIVMPNADIVLNTGVTLYVQTVLSQFALSTILLSKHKQEEVLEFQEGKPVIQYSFYETSSIQDLASSDILSGGKWTLKLSDRGGVTSVQCGTQQFSDSDYEGVWKDMLVGAEKEE
jgi:hypothetical protein